MPSQVSIHKVKKVDKDTYKKRQSWNLAELREVDGKDSKIVRNLVCVTKITVNVSLKTIEKRGYLTTLLTS